MATDETYLQHHSYSVPAPREHLNSFFAYSTALEDQRSAHLYFLGHIIAEPTDTRQIAAKVIGSFRQRFFQPKLESTFEERFEWALRSINTDLGQINEYYQKNQQSFHLNGAIALVIDNQIICAGCGEAGIRLVSHGSSKTIYSPRHDFDFSEIVSGQLSKDECLVFFTSGAEPHISSLSDLADPEKMAKKVASIKSLTDGIIAVYLDRPNPELEATVTKAPTLADRLAQLLDRVKKIITPAAKPARDAAKPGIKQKTKHKSQNAWNTLWGKYINPNPKIAIIIVFSTIILVVGGWLAFRAYNPHGQELKKQYATIERLYTDAKTASTNKQNSTSAEANLNQAKQLIGALKPEDKKDLATILDTEGKTSLDELSREISLLLDELHGIFTVEPTPVFTGPAEESYSYAEILGQVSYLIDTESGTLKRYDLLKNALLGSSKSPLLESISATTISDGLGAIFAQQGAKLIQIRQDGTVSEQKNTGGGWPQNTDDFATFTNNLYFLSSTENQIYRYNKLASGFGPQASYLKKPTSGLLTDATALTINGNVFVAKKNGQVMLFDQGNSKEFTIQNMPAVSSAAQIALLDTPDQLIMLDSAKKAFVIIDLKTEGAEFNKELVVNNVDRIESFVLDKKNKTVYFTAKNVLYKLGLQ